jgi:hypothetical protein
MASFVALYTMKQNVSRVLLRKRKRTEADTIQFVGFTRIKTMEILGTGSYMNSTTLHNVVFLIIRHCKVRTALVTGIQSS